MNLEETLYQAAKNALGHHKTLDNTVPPELGCAEAWSAVGRDAGVPGIPAAGFPGTDAVYAWIRQNPSFEEIQLPEPGATIVSPTVGNVHGHIGIFGGFNTQYTNDWGICSNDSSTGLFREQWCLKDWLNYYKARLGLSVHIFRYVG